MKHLKFTFLLTIFMSMVGAKAFAYDAMIDGIYYNFSESGATVTYYSYDSSTNYYYYWGDIVIPESVTYGGKNYIVTSIGDHAFDSCSDITSIKIPNSVTSIGYMAFYHCSGLKKVIVSDIAAWCTINFDWEANPLSYAHHLYSSENAEIKKLIIPEGITSISHRAFSGCSGLSSVSIPNSVRIIDSSAFSGCSGLTSVTIPNSVISIGNYAFSSCSGLASVTIGNSVRIIEEGAFSGCTGLTAITIPSNVAGIGECAFENCSGLTSITIPSSVTSIGDDAFCGCSGLTTIRVDSQNKNFDSRNNCNALIVTSTNKLIQGCKTTIIPNSVTSIGKEAFYWCSGLTSVTIPNSVTSIGDYAFSGCSGLTSLTIPNSVTSIGKRAFSSCSGLTSVSIGSGVTSLGEDAFSGCSGLTSVTLNSNSIASKSYDSLSSLKNVFGSQVTKYIIGNSVTRIGSYAFYGCANTTSITIGNSVTSIGSNAFKGCSNLTLTLNCNALVSKEYTGSKENLGKIIGEQVSRLIIGNEVTSIGKNAFHSYSSLTSVTIGNSVTSIGEYAFYICSSLTSITIPNSVTSIGRSAFYGCSGLTSVIIGNSVTSIGINAFGGCSGLSSVIIGNSVTSIGLGAFFNTAWYNNQPDGLVYAGKVAYDYKGTMPANTSISIKNGTLGIAAGAFSGCSGLTSIDIPNSVTSIDDLAFYECSSLTSVTALNPTPVNITQNVFTNRTNATLYVPKGSKSAYQAADYWKEFKVIIEMAPASTNITFADANVKALCVANWDINGNGELSEAEAAAVTDLGEVFKNNSTITSFNELRYFTGLTSIGSYAFEGCSGLTSVTIPNSVTSIGSDAFSGCTGLKKVIAKDIAAWCNISFRNSYANPLRNAHYLYSDENTEITNLVIPNSVTSIGIYAFYDCWGLTSVTIPNSVTSIGSYAFEGCSGLTSVTIPNSVTSIDGYAFEGCWGLTSVTIPNSVTSIGSDAFNNTTWYNNQLDGLVYAGKVAYKYKGTMPANTVISILEGTLGIAGSAFKDCTSLTSVTIPSSVTSIGVYAFSGCSGLTSVTIPNSVTSIGSSAFYKCSGLTSVTIPNSVTSIGSWAFYGCSGLTSVTALNPTPVAITEYVFTNRKKATLYVPKGSKTAYQAADYWKEFKEIVEIDPTGIKAVENEQIAGSDETGNWYTLDGRRLSGKPTKRGIYIVNGRKVVVK